MKTPLEMKIDHLYKKFGQRTLLDGVQITLRGGQCQLLSGANGAGKTTLLRIIAGLDKPDSSTIDMGSGPKKWERCRSLLHSRVIYLHQHPYMFDGTVKYNLGYALPRGLDRKTGIDRIEYALHWADLHRHANTPAKSLSGGERQRVALARAWLSTPRVLLLDEPTVNMDKESCLWTLKLLRSLKTDGIALVVVSHDPVLFYGLLDSHLHLVNGQLERRDQQSTIAKTYSKVTPIRRRRA